MEPPKVNDKDRAAVEATIARVAAERAADAARDAKLRQELATALGTKVVALAEKQGVDEKRYRSLTAAATGAKGDAEAAAELEKLRAHIAPGLADHHPGPGFGSTVPLMAGTGLPCGRPIPSTVDPRAIAALLQPLTQTATPPFSLGDATPAATSNAATGGIGAGVDAGAIGAPSEHATLGAIFALRPTDRVVTFSAAWDDSSLTMHLDALGYAHAWGGWSLELYNRTELIATWPAGTTGADRWFLLGGMDLTEPPAAQSAGFVQNLWQPEPVVALVLRAHADATVFGWSSARLAIGGLLRSLTVQSSP